MLRLIKLPRWPESCAHWISENLIMLLLSGSILEPSLIFCLTLGSCNICPCILLPCWGWAPALVTLPFFPPKAHHSIDSHDSTSRDLRVNSLSANKSWFSLVYLNGMRLPPLPGFSGLPPLLGFSGLCLVERPCRACRLHGWHTSPLLTKPLLKPVENSRVNTTQVLIHTPLE